MSDYNEPLDGRTRLPETYDESDQKPERVESDELGIKHPERYEQCPACGEQAYGEDDCDQSACYDYSHLSDEEREQLKWCRACGHTPFQREKSYDDDVKKMLAEANARIEATKHLCEEFKCKNFAVVECEFPMYSDYDGSHLGDEVRRYCAPCYSDAHDGDGTNYVREMRPVRVKYI